MATTEYLDLLLDNGEIVRIEYPDKHEDDFLETLDFCRKRNDSLCMSRWDGARAKYLGIGLDKVNMGRVVGQL